MSIPRIIIDSDAYNQVDDQFAVTYALLSPEVSVEALYAAPFVREHACSPEEGMQKSYEELLRVQWAMGREVPVYRGASHFFGHGADRSEAVMDLMQRGPVTVVAIGALTNVACALTYCPALQDSLSVLWLGGQAGGQQD